MYVHACAVCPSLPTLRYVRIVNTSESEIHSGKTQQMGYDKEGVCVDFQNHERTTDWHYLGELIKNRKSINACVHNVKIKT